MSALAASRLARDAARGPTIILGTHPESSHRVLELEVDEQKGGKGGGARNLPVARLRGAGGRAVASCLFALFPLGRENGSFPGPSFPPLRVRGGMIARPPRCAPAPPGSPARCAWSLRCASRWERVAGAATVSINPSHLVSPTAAARSRARAPSCYPARADSRPRRAAVRSRR